MKKTWKKMRVVKGTSPHFFVTGDIVEVSDFGKKYYHVKNPRTGYSSDDAGWYKNRFEPVHELDAILGV